MTDRQAFNKKMIYLGAVIPLLYLLYVLGRPESTDAAGNFQGGQLAKLRHEHGLSQSDLGEVDPVSESFKLATLGLRPIAVVLLWEKCNLYKKTEDWSNFEAALKQITYLQPNFIRVWDYQAHNLSFNISAELDDWRDRYYYVIKGLKFLITGTHYNAHDSLLLNRIGWFVGQKIGRSDEKVLYRRRFAQDNELHDYLDLEVAHAAGRDPKQPNEPEPSAQPRGDELQRAQREWDSWLVSKNWYRVSEMAAGKPFLSPIRGESKVIFYSHAPMSQIFYARTLADEGQFHDAGKVRAAWQTAQDDWGALGAREFFAYEGWPFRLNEQEDYQKRADKLREELDALVGPEVRAKLRADKLKTLSPPEVAAVNKPLKDRTAEELQAAAMAESRLEIDDGEIAIRAVAEKRPTAARLVFQIRDALARAQSISSFRDHVNFAYWRLRCEAERTEDYLAARRLSAQARREQKESSLTDATRETFEAALAKWRAVIDKFPALFFPTTSDSGANTEDIYDIVLDYRKLLHDRDEKMPEKFILQDVLDRHEKQ